MHERASRERLYTQRHYELLPGSIVMSAIDAGRCGRAALQSIRDIGTKARRGGQVGLYDV